MMTTVMTPTMSPSSSQIATVVPRIHQPYTYETIVGISAGFFIILIIIIIIIIIRKRRAYRALSGNDGVELEMQDPLIRNDTESVV